MERNSVIKSVISVMAQLAFLPVFAHYDGGMEGNVMVEGGMNTSFFNHRLYSGIENEYHPGLHVAFGHVTDYVLKVDKKIFFDSYDSSCQWYIGNAKKSVIAKEIRTGFQMDFGYPFGFGKNGTFYATIGIRFSVVMGNMKYDVSESTQLLNLKRCRFDTPFAIQYLYDYSFFVSCGINRELGNSLSRESRKDLDGRLKFYSPFICIGYYFEF